MRLEFTPKELKFAETVANGSSFADAYRLAYHGTTDKAVYIGQAAYTLVKRPEIHALIVERQKELSAKFRVTREWLMNWHYQRIIYDPAELTRMERGCCRHCHGDGHQPQWREPDYMDALAKAEKNGDPLPDIAGGFGYNFYREPHPGCPQCDGRGITRPWFADTADLSASARAAFEGVKETRQGLEIKMADKHAAALELAKLAGLHVDQIKVTTDIPDDAVLATLSPADVAQTYCRVMGTTH